MEDISRCCAFTGHRPHKLPWGYDESDERCRAVKGALAGQIRTLAELRSVTCFLSGMADGTDVWAAQAVLELRRERPVRLCCVLPHPGQADRWNREAQERYRAVLAEADGVLTLADRYYNGCMQARNRYLVPKSNRSSQPASLNQTFSPAYGSDTGPFGYLTRPIVETCRLRKGIGGKYQTAKGRVYDCSCSIEALVTDEYHDVPYWTRTVVEHNGEDYYLIGYKGLSMSGLTVRIRA